MDEWGDLDARLERKKRVKLRRQQRELKKQQRQLDAQEKERQKLVLRCAEMAREDVLSVAMMRLYRQQARQKQREIQREEDMAVYAETAKVRKQAQLLGLPVETHGAAGKTRLAELRHRIEAKEAAKESALQAKQRLDALPKKRSRARRLLESFFSSSTRAKLDRAVYDRDCDSIAALLDIKAIVPVTKRCDPSLLNHESQNGLTPVLCAIYQNELTLLRRLLESGASPNHETEAAGVTPVLACVLVDNVIALDLLVEFHGDLKHEAQSGVTALLLAADKGRNDLMKTLLRLGVGVNDANRDGRTPLTQAVVSGHYETTKILLAFEADKHAVDTAGRSALAWARHWKWDHIASLLTAGTASETLRAMIQEQDERESDAPNSLAQQIIRQQSMAPGRVAMETALRDGNVDRIRDLLSVDDTAYGPNFETSTGATALLVVSEKGTKDDVLYCLERRCIATHCNREGVNALMTAARHGNREILQLLIRAGCSVWSRDLRGRDAVRYLHDNEHHDLVASLMTAHLPVARPRIHLGQPLDGIAALRPSVAQSSGAGTAPSEQPLCGGTGESDGDRETGSEDATDGDSSSQEANALEDGDDWSKSHTWTLRRRALRKDARRNVSFEVERQKILRYAERGRRNGLIAPLPHDKAGRFKFPPCDNCHNNRARKRCFLCDQVLCDRCHARLHELPHRRHHEYEELRPVRMVGTRSMEEVVANQEAFLKGTLARSFSCLDAIKHTLLPSPILTTTASATIDLEAEKYRQRHRVIREKEIASAQINVPVAAVSHASRAGEAAIYTSPAELKLADLYIAQGKLAKARNLMDVAKRTAEESLGLLHPTMLKILLRLARIEQQNGDLERSWDTIQSALGTFESAVAADSEDLITAQELGLRVLVRFYVFCSHCSEFIRSSSPESCLLTCRIPSQTILLQWSNAGVSIACGSSGCRAPTPWFSKCNRIWTCSLPSARKKRCVKKIFWSSSKRLRMPSSSKSIARKENGTLHHSVFEKGCCLVTNTAMILIGN
jgi:uncharacterized protein